MLQAPSQPPEDGSEEGCKGSEEGCEGVMEPNDRNGNGDGATEGIVMGLSFWPKVGEHVE